jgi:hypothetical protein
MRSFQRLVINHDGFPLLREDFHRIAFEYGSYPYPTLCPPTVYDHSYSSSLIFPARGSVVVHNPRNQSDCKWLTSSRSLWSASENAVVYDYELDPFPTVLFLGLCAAKHRLGYDFWLHMPKKSFNEEDVIAKFNGMFGTCMTRAYLMDNDPVGELMASARKVTQP